MRMKGGKNMSLKDLRPMLWGPVRIYEDVTEKDDIVTYKDLFEGECRDIPESLHGRQIFLISGYDKRTGGIEIQVMSGS